MAEEEKTEETGYKNANDGGGQKGPLVLVILLLNTALMGAVAFFQYTSHQKQAQQQTIIDVVKAEMKKVELGEGEEEGPGTTREDDGIIFPLETFTANLAQGDGPRRFLRLNAVLKFSKVSSEEEFKARKPQIRDTIISILNSKRPADLLKVEGKAYLKEEIKAAINTFLVDSAVIDIYYVGFQVK